MLHYYYMSLVDHSTGTRCNNIDEARADALEYLRRMPRGTQAVIKAWDDETDAHLEVAGPIACPDDLWLEAEPCPQCGQPMRCLICGIRIDATTWRRTKHGLWHHVCDDCYHDWDHGEIGTPWSWDDCRAAVELQGRRPPYEAGFELCF